VSRGTGEGVTPEALLAEASRVEQYGYTEHVRFLRASADSLAALTAEVQRLRGVVDAIRRGNAAVSTCGGTPPAADTEGKDG